MSNPKQATFPASTPDSCLDYIAGYVNNGQPFTRLSAWVPEEAVASDHRPVVTEVRLKAKPEEIFLCGALSPKSYGGRYNGDVADPCPYV